MKDKQGRSLYIVFEKRYTGRQREIAKIYFVPTKMKTTPRNVRAVLLTCECFFTMKEKHTFKREIRKVVRTMAAVALCLLSATAWAEGGTPDFYKEAEAGQAWAQYEVGECYYYGKGVSRDYAEAVKWYRKAADQGNADAQQGLGRCYYYGTGVSKDYAEAVKWLRLSADQGHAEAQVCLGWCYENGEGVSKDMTEAVRLYRLAAEQGNANAQCNLGVCYENGEGVSKDMAEARRWYQKAADQGNEYAKKALKRL